LTIQSPDSNLSTESQALESVRHNYLNAKFESPMEARTKEKLGQGYMRSSFNGLHLHYLFLKDKTLDCAAVPWLFLLIKSNIPIRSLSLTLKKGFQVVYIPAITPSSISYISYVLAWYFMILRNSVSSLVPGYLVLFQTISKAAITIPAYFNDL